MKTLRSIVLIAFVICTVAPLLAEETPTPTPKPGPGHEKLGYFVGKWKCDAEVKPSPFGPGGKVVTEDTCEWFEGKFAVVCRSKGKGPTGDVAGLGILGYEPTSGSYTYYGTSNDGMTMLTVPRGTVTGKVWTYLDESEMGGHKMKSRYTMEQVSDTAYTFKWELEGPNGWSTVMEGRNTRR